MAKETDEELKTSQEEEELKKQQRLALEQQLKAQAEKQYGEYAKFNSEIKLKTTNGVVNLTLSKTGDPNVFLHTSEEHPGVVVRESKNDTGFFKFDLPDDTKKPTAGEEFIIKVPRLGENGERLTAEGSHDLIILNHKGEVTSFALAEKGSSQVDLAWLNDKVKAQESRAEISISSSGPAINSISQPLNTVAQDVIYAPNPVRINDQGTQPSAIPDKQPSQGLISQSPNVNTNPSPVLDPSPNVNTKTGRKTSPVSQGSNVETPIGPPKLNKRAAATQPLTEPKQAQYDLNSPNTKVAPISDNLVNVDSSGQVNSKVESKALTLKKVEKAVNAIPRNALDTGLNPISAAYKDLSLSKSETPGGNGIENSTNINTVLASKDNKQEISSIVQHKISTITNSESITNEYSARSRLEQRLKKNKENLVANNSQTINLDLGQLKQIEEKRIVENRKKKSNTSNEINNNQLKSKIDNADINKVEKNASTITHEKSLKKQQQKSGKTQIIAKVSFIDSLTKQNKKDGIKTYTKREYTQADKAAQVKKIADMQKKLEQSSNSAKTKTLISVGALVKKNVNHYKI